MFKNSLFKIKESGLKARAISDKNLRFTGGEKDIYEIEVIDETLSPSYFISVDDLELLEL